MMYYMLKRCRTYYIRVCQGYHEQIMRITRFWTQRADLGTNWFLQVTFAFKTMFSPLFVDFFNFSTELTASDTFLHALLYFFMMNYTWKTSRKSYLCVCRGYHGQIMMITRFWIHRAGLGTNWFLQVTFAFKTRFSTLFVDFFNFSTEMTASDTFYMTCYTFSWWIIRERRLESHIYVSGGDIMGK